MAASASVMLPGSIFSISLRASAVRFAWAIKPTIRWPLSYHERAEVSVSRLNTKKVDRKVALNGAGEVGIIKLVCWRRSLVENGASETAGVAQTTPVASLLLTVDRWDGYHKFTGQVFNLDNGSVGFLIFLMCISFGLNFRRRLLCVKEF